MDLLLLLPTRSSCRLPIRTRAHARFRCQCGSIVPLAFSGKNVCICCGGGITHGRCVCSIPLYRICTPLPHRWVTARRESAIHICISIGRCFRSQLLYGLPHRYGSRSNGSCLGYTETVRTFTCIQRFLSRMRCSARRRQHDFLRIFGLRRRNRGFNCIKSSNLIVNQRAVVQQDVPHSHRHAFLALCVASIPSNAEVGDLFIFLTFQLALHILQHTPTIDVRGALSAFLQHNGHLVPCCIRLCLPIAAVLLDRLSVTTQ
ncbi:hypothetical protein ECC02_007738 [Trypanosoma cruzi]|uniref:Uncharacterized protein n=1 Tax=Trypanosoma cruzi TaxID=5693 RepID=A0A7J6XXZ4_TRYCR|nr:hypothetical protein ECC02_007738 [Trypanosoma cruzi]